MYIYIYMGGCQTDPVTKYYKTVFSYPGALSCCLAVCCPGRVLPATSVSSGSAPLGSARLGLGGSARLGSVRLGWAGLGWLRAGSLEAGDLVPRVSHARRLEGVGGLVHSLSFEKFEISLFNTPLEFAYPKRMRLGADK